MGQLLSTLAEKTGVIVRSKESGAMDLTFDEALISFLRRAAEEGMDLDQVTLSIFDEVFANEDDPMPFDGTLATFSMYLCDALNLRRRIGSTLLEVVMPATVAGRDIYDLIGELEMQLEEKQQAALAIVREATARHRQEAHGFPDVSGVPFGTRHVRVVRERAARVS